MDMLKTNMETFEQKLDYLVQNLHKIPDEFWVRTENDTEVIWLLDQEDGTAESYSTSQERIGLTRDGRVLWGFSSGCSCWSGWETNDYCPTKNWKEFSINEDFLAIRNNGADTIDLNQTIYEFTLLVNENTSPEEVLKAQNAEIRRYLIKRIGYEKIKDSVNATVLHKDGDNELLKFENDEMYVKVKDSSTDREYLLFVEGKHETCRSAIAWTFGLTEDEYQPLIET